MNRYRYKSRSRSLVKQYAKIALILVIVPILLFAPAEAILPEILIPNFLLKKSVFIILVEYQSAWLYIGLLAAVILCLKLLYDAVS